MAAPVLGNRNAFFVNYVGTDDPGYNQIGAPWSYRTIGAALAALAGVANPPSATNPWVIAVGPGVFTEAGLSIPPWVWITGSADDEGGILTQLSISADINLSAGWAANATARGGLANLDIRAASGTPHIDLTMPAPSAGNPSRTVEINNVRENLVLFTYQAASTADALKINGLIQDGVIGNSVAFLGGILTINQLLSAAAVSITSGATYAVAAAITASQLPSVTVTKGAAACAVGFDAVSWPLRGNVTLVGGPTLSRLSDANADGYSPTTPANWPVVPTTVQEALDDLAAGGAVVPANGYATAVNNAGNATITPTAHNYFLALTVGGVARTSVEILSVATPPAAGDRIYVGITLPATPAIILEFRNAVVGGTLIYTFTTDGATLSVLFQFVFDGAAWQPAGYQIPYQT